MIYLTTMTSTPFSLLLMCVLFAGHAAAFGAGALSPTSQFQGYV